MALVPMSYEYIDDVLNRLMPYVPIDWVPNSSITITFSGTFRGILFGYHHNTSAIFFALQLAGSTASSAFKMLYENSRYSITNNDNKITINNTGSAGTTVLRLLCFDGPNNISFAVNS